MIFALVWDAIIRTENLLHIHTYYSKTNKIINLLLIRKLNTLIFIIQVPLAVTWK